jgi:hypothetical protein
MNISSSTNASLLSALSGPKVQSMGREASEPKSMQENDGDKDDLNVGATMQNSSSMNMSQQAIGQNISITA